MTRAEVDARRGRSGGRGRAGSGPRRPSSQTAPRRPNRRRPYRPWHGDPALVRDARPAVTHPARDLGARPRRRGVAGRPARSRARPRPSARLRAAGRAGAVRHQQLASPARPTRRPSSSGLGIPADGDVLTSAMAAARLVEPGERALVCGGPGIAEALRGPGRRRPVRDGDADAVVGRLPPRLRLRAPAGRRPGRPARAPA